VKEGSLERKIIGPENGGNTTNSKNSKAQNLLVTGVILNVQMRCEY
jgi:hypothetical protein